MQCKFIIHHVRNHTSEHAGGYFNKLSLCKRWHHLHNVNQSVLIFISPRVLSSILKQNQQPLALMGSAISCRPTESAQLSQSAKITRICITVKQCMSCRHGAGIWTLKHFKSCYSSSVARNKSVHKNGDLFYAKPPCLPSAAKAGSNPTASTSKHSMVPNLHHGLEVTYGQCLQYFCGVSLSFSGVTRDLFFPWQPDVFTLISPPYYI